MTPILHTRESPCIHLIINPTNRKTSTSNLNLGSLKQSDPKRRMQDWMGLVAKSPIKEVTALELYAGDHWTIAKQIRTEFDTSCVRIWIMSPGYGLVEAEEPIKPYTATFSPDHEESVARGGSLALSNLNWWDMLTQWQPFQEKKPRSIFQLITQFSNHRFILLGSSRYMNLLKNEFKNIELHMPANLENLYIISPRTKNIGPLLTNNLMPSYRSLRPLLGGGDASLNIRTGRYLLNLIMTQTLSVTEVKANMHQLITELPPLKIRSRTLISNEELSDHIRALLTENPILSMSSGIKMLRESGLACSQKRFRNAYQSTIAKIMDKKNR